MTRKAVHVIRDFPVSDDGIHSRHLCAGTTDEVPAELFDALEAEGYVSEIAAPAPSETAQPETAAAETKRGPGRPRRKT